MEYATLPQPVGRYESSSSPSIYLHHWQPPYYSDRHGLPAVESKPQSQLSGLPDSQSEPKRQSMGSAMEYILTNSLSTGSGQQPNLQHMQSPFGNPSPNVKSSSSGDHARTVFSRPKPQCWDHGCNGREFSTFSNLLRHQHQCSSQSPPRRQSTWSDDEDAQIVDLRESGMKWEEISKRLPGRSAISCRLQYQYCLQRRSMQDTEYKNGQSKYLQDLKAPTASDQPGGVNSLSKPTLQSQAPDTPSSPSRNQQTLDYHMQLLLLERQSKKRLMAIRQEQDSIAAREHGPYPSPPLKNQLAAQLEDPQRGRSLRRRDSNASLLSERLSEAGRYHFQEAASRAASPIPYRNRSPFRPESPFYDHHEYPSQRSSSPFETIDPSDINYWMSGVSNPGFASHSLSTTTIESSPIEASNHRDSNSEGIYHDFHGHQQDPYRYPSPSLNRTMTDIFANSRYIPNVEIPSEELNVTPATDLGGPFTCTYHGCTQRFHSPSKLQKHKREVHRQSLTSHKDTVNEVTSNRCVEAINQASGPHKCDQINPSTGKSCNTIFSREYDLIRHENTIHNASKRKVRCHLCTEQKTFREDQLAAETAELVFYSPKDITAAKELYADIKRRVKAAGRNQNHLKILPAALIIVGNTVEEAKQKRLDLDSLVHYDSAISSLSISLGTDASKFEPDELLPDEIPETNAGKSSREGVIKLAKEEKLTVRQLAQRYGGYSGLAFVGTPETIANDMAKWLEEEASDGFTVTLPFLPQGLDDIVERLVPELQRRGLFRKSQTTFLHNRSQRG